MSEKKLFFVRVVISEIIPFFVTPKKNPFSVREVINYSFIIPGYLYNSFRICTLHIFFPQKFVPFSFLTYFLEPFPHRSFNPEHSFVKNRIRMHFLLTTMAI
jgi:hypothetical protein